MLSWLCALKWLPFQNQNEIRVWNTPYPNPNPNPILSTETGFFKSVSCKTRKTIRININIIRYKLKTTIDYRL